jgi:hypothetical protein
MAAVRHWSVAHRFFSTARWDLDALGLATARMLVATFTSDGQALTVAVDDTLFHRNGRREKGVPTSARKAHGKLIEGGVVQGWKALGALALT